MPDAGERTEPTEVEAPEGLADAVAPPTRYVSWSDLERVADEAADIDTIVQKELTTLRRQGLLDESPAFELRDGRRSGRRRLRRVGTVASIIVAAGLAAVVIPRVTTGRNVPTEPSSVASPSPAGVAPTPQPSRSPAAAKVVNAIRAQLFVAAPCWVRTVADGRVVFTGTLGQGTRTFRARDSLSIRLGNAGGVRLVVNGRTVPTGAAGEVMDLSFALKHGEVVGPSQPGLS